MYRRCLGRTQACREGLKRGRIKTPRTHTGRKPPPSPGQPRDRRSRPPTPNKERASARRRVLKRSICRTSTYLLLASLLGGFEQRSFREGGDPVLTVRLQLFDPHPARKHNKEKGQASDTGDARPRYERGGNARFNHPVAAGTHHDGIGFVDLRQEALIEGNRSMGRGIGRQNIGLLYALLAQKATGAGNHITHASRSCWTTSETGVARKDLDFLDPSRSACRSAGQPPGTHRIFLASSRLSISSSWSCGVLKRARGRSFAISSRSSCKPVPGRTSGQDAKEES